MLLFAGYIVFSATEEFRPHNVGRILIGLGLMLLSLTLIREATKPLTDASHVKNALARFDQVEGVSDADRELAFANIKKAAQYYGVELRENSWRELGARRVPVPALAVRP